MLKPDLPEKQKSLVVDPRGMEVVLADDSGAPLSFVLPPMEEIQEIAELKGANQSIQELYAGKARQIIGEFKQALDREKRKAGRFLDSPTYLNRLANLAAAAREFDEEAHYLELARARSDDSFFSHRWGDNLLMRGKDIEAESLFRNLDLASDLYANLKLAAFHVYRKELDRAAERVEQAVNIDPSSYAARLFEGGLALVRGDYHSAVHSFRLASQERPTSSVLYSNLGIAYIKLGEPAKAFSALKRAVALAPLNLNAVFLLADYSFQQKLDEEAIPSLRYLLTFEQKTAGAWSRMARACMQIGRVHEAISALKREASLAESPGIWNNLGVAYHRLHDSDRALRAFKHAMTMSAESPDRTYFLAARNIAQLLANRSFDSRLLKFTRTVLEDDSSGICRSDSELSDLYAFYLHALRVTGRVEDMKKEAEGILTFSDVADSLSAWILATLIATYALQNETREIALRLIEDYRFIIDGVSLDANWAAMLYNNVAFALAEAGRLEEAEGYLRRIAKTMHVEAYPTATLGLIDIRKGNVERGFLRYRKAVGLATKREDKNRIRQKLDLELGRYWIERNRLKAARYLARAAKAAGESVLSEQAKNELVKLRQLRNENNLSGD